MSLELRLMNFAFLICALGLTACGKHKTVHDEQAAGLSPTIYYKPVVHIENEKCSSNDLVDMKTKQGATLATLCKATYKNCLLQGSCYIIQGNQTKMIGYGGEHTDGYNFVEVDYKRCPYGWGVKEICLDPYFSIAADMKYFDAGDVIYVPKLVGVALPTGETHDGYMIVRDEGGGITGPARFDFFTGLLDHRSKKNPFATLGFGDQTNRFEFRIVKGDEAKQALKRRGYPGILPSVQKPLGLE